MPLPVPLAPIKSADPTGKLCLNYYRRNHYGSTTPGVALVLRALATPGRFGGVAGGAPDVVDLLLFPEPLHLRSRKRFSSEVTQREAQD